LYPAIERTSNTLNHIHGLTLKPTHIGLSTEAQFSHTHSLHECDRGQVDERSSALPPCALVRTCAPHTLCMLYLNVIERTLVRSSTLVQKPSLESAHKVFDKIPQPIVSMPRGQASSSWSYGTQAIVARPTFQSWKLMLEKSFAVKEDFTKFEATSWAVQ
jgi:hypothetical protein